MYTIFPFLGNVCKSSAYIFRFFILKTFVYVLIGVIQLLTNEISNAKIVGFLLIKVRCMFF